MISQQPDAEPGAPSPSAGVLRQMLDRRQAEAQSGRPPQLPRPVPGTPARVAATAFGRVADRLHALAVQPLEVTAGALTLAELTEVLPERPLLGILQGPGDSLGAVALCPEAVTALIEVQTLGRVTARSGERRRPTRSEAMLCTDFINALLHEINSDLAGTPGFEGLGAFRFVTALDEPRSLGLLLDHDAFRTIDFRMRLGAPTSRDGQVLLALPQLSAAAAPRPAAETGAVPALPAAAGTAPVPEAAPAAVDLAEAIQEAPVDVVGVLCRRRISLKELRGLTEGRLLMLPRARLTDARIETADGQLLARGRFGEAGGCHAIRLGEAAADAGDAAPGQSVGGLFPSPDILVPHPIPMELDDPFRMGLSHEAGPDAGFDLPDSRIAS